LASSTARHPSAATRPRCQVCDAAEHSAGDVLARRRRTTCAMAAARPLSVDPMSCVCRPGSVTLMPRSCQDRRQECRSDSLLRLLRLASVSVAVECIRAGCIGHTELQCRLAAGAMEVEAKRWTIRASPGDGAMWTHRDRSPRLAHLPPVRFMHACMHVWSPLIDHRPLRYGRATLKLGNFSP
jgi:hypothetical protein